MDGFLGVFLPNKAQLKSFAENGESVQPVIHYLHLKHVRNRRYVIRDYALNSGQTWTLDTTYVVPSAAVRTSDGSLTYRRDADPQPLVTPENLDVKVTWPPGWHPSEALPDGWTATPGGARRLGPLPDTMSVAIPLARG